MTVDKTHILKELKKYKEFQKDAEFARFLEIGANVLSNWYKRNTFDEHIIVSKFPEVNEVWLLTGKGEMLKSDESPQKDESTEGRECPMNDLLQSVLENSRAITDTMKDIVDSNASLIKQQTELIATIRALAEKK